MYKYIIFILCCFECVRGELLNKREGAACTWQGRNGTCAHMYRCNSAQDNIKARDYPPICSFEGKDPIICCTDCKLIHDYRNRIKTENLGYLVKTNRTSGQKCYDYLLSLDYPCKDSYKLVIEYHVNETNNCNALKVRITNFNRTSYDDGKNRLTFMAYLGYGDNVDTADWLCWGSVISERFILTAAQCIKPENSTTQVKFIALGINRQGPSPSTWELYNVKRAIPFPRYNRQSRYHDIALLETDKEIIFGPYVKPACIYFPSDSGRAPETKSVVLAETGNKTVAYANTTRFREDECSYFYPKQLVLRNGFDPRGQSCFGQKKKPADTCKSGLGSPIIEFTYCIEVISSIASIDRTCGDAGGSGLYTKVLPYVPWIEEIVWPVAPKT